MRHGGVVKGSGKKVPKINKELKKKEDKVGWGYWGRGVIPLEGATGTGRS